MYRSQYFEGGRVLTAAMSAVDLALHDIMGKHLKVQCHRPPPPAFIWNEPIKAHTDEGAASD